ncbi:MAG: type I restriction enzyme HsdR N-terminal domain-containing protein [Polyangia bacterium]
MSEQVRKRQGHIRGEEATKQALVLPFLHALGFDIYDPTEIRPEYVADFAKKKSNGQFEKIDYALYVKGELAIFVETKSIECKPEDHDGQLSRYFNATPSVRVAVLTNGLTYRFFTDLRAPNLMDASPFFEFNILSFTEREAEMLKPFTKDGFNSATVQRHAEEVISMEKVTTLVDDLLRNPSDSFVRFILGELELVSGRITEKVVERFTPIVKKSIHSAVTGMVTKSIQQEIAPASPPAAEHSPPPSDTRPPAAAEPAPGREPAAVVTTEEELEIFGIVSRLCAESAVKVPIKYKDTVTYFGINIGVVTRWFLRVYTNGPRKFIATRVAPEQAARLAPGFQVEPAPESAGKSRVFFNTAADVERMRALVIVAYEEEVKRRDSGAPEDAAESAA